MKSAISAVIFDYGKVLCEWPLPSDVELMAGICHLTRQRFDQLYWQFRDPYDQGKLNGNEYWQSIADGAGLVLDEDQVRQLIELDCQSWLRPRQHTLLWADILRSKGFLTPILSNMPFDVGTQVKQCSWIAPFAPCVFSSQVGHIKPQRAIYEYCLKLLQLSPEQTLFLDDREVNVEGARLAGMHALCFASLEEVALELAGRFDLPLPAEMHLKTGSS